LKQKIKCDVYPAAPEEMMNYGDEISKRNGICSSVEERQ